MDQRILMVLSQQEVVVSVYIRLLVLQTVGETGFGSGSSLKVSTLGFFINIEEGGRLRENE